MKLVFKHPPRLGFTTLDHRPEPNQIVVRLDPSTGIRLIVDAHRADHKGSAEITFDGGEGPTPCEVLLHAAMIGDNLRFTRQGAVDEKWGIMQPLLDAPPPVQPYPPGCWGPEAANALVARHGRWHGPWIES
jgi:glucose-6-phosphate 1-dehydrogenase